MLQGFGLRMCPSASARTLRGRWVGFAAYLFPRPTFGQGHKGVAKLTLGENEPSSLAKGEGDACWGGRYNYGLHRYGWVSYLAFNPEELWKRLSCEPDWKEFPLCPEGLAPHEQDSTTHRHTRGRCLAFEEWRRFSSRMWEATEQIDIWKRQLVVGATSHLVGDSAWESSTGMPVPGGLLPSVPQRPPPPPRTTSQPSHAGRDQTSHGVNLAHGTAWSPGAKGPVDLSHKSPGGALKFEFQISYSRNMTVFSGLE